MMSDISEYLDTVFDTLSSSTRRRSLTYLHSDLDDHAASVDDIASYLSGETGGDIESMKIGLTQIHLPKLEEQGWVNYDRRNGYVTDATISADTKDDILLDYLSEVPEEDDEHLDQVFSVLSDERRRKTLYLLEKEKDRRYTIGGLAGSLSGESGDIDVTKANLHHVHLPLLDDSGWVDYDPDTGKVSLTIDTDQDPDGLLLQYLEDAYDEEI